VLPALGNLHLLPYGVQEGQVVIGTPIGQAVMGQIRERSTAEFTRIVIRGRGTARPTRPSAMAAANGAPLPGGATLRVAVDVPARVEIEVSRDPRFRRGRRLPVERTDAFDAVLAQVRGMAGSNRVYWRAHMRRRGERSVGPTRSFRPLPPAGSRERARIIVGSCAAQFGPIFDVLSEREPDAFVWQGDLNYPDTVGPLAQSIAGYAGIWRDFLANPRMDAILGRSLFAAQRDDHDYGVQDANSTNLVPWGLRPWRALMERRTYFRFSAGVADFWVLDQRLHKSDPEDADTAAKTLLGKEQRRWLLRTLAGSRAAFKVICTPCTLAPLAANARDGSWAAGFEAERDLLLAHIAKRVAGRTIFIAGDTHWTMAYERDGLFEARPCPLGIPTPNDITLTDPQAAESARAQPGVVYADDTRGHFAQLDVGGVGARPNLRLSLVRDDGDVAYERSFS
jgi:phosphodiesterase/alkaline phosphatase D-like protein